MDSIKKLLERYSKITPPNESIRTATQAVVERLCGVKVPTQDISYRGGVVYVSTKPTTRSAILTNKTNILEQIEKEVGKKIRDIR